jgi:putative membrane protein
MIRLLISILIHLAANAVGLLLAATLLDGMSINGTAFVIAVAIFTGVEVLLRPMVRQLAVTKANALLGSTALVVSLLGLIITTLVSDGLSIEGLSTWALATVIVWLGALIATLILPILFVKKAVDGKPDRVDLAAGRKTDLPNKG